MERREHRRFDLQVKVQFHWTDAAGVHHLGWGRTRDISTGGMFVHSDSLPPLDAEVETELFFPAPQLDLTGIRMTSRARVLRLEPGSPRQTNGGFAAASQEFALWGRKSSEVSSDENQ